MDHGEVKCIKRCGNKHCKIGSGNLQLWILVRVIDPIFGAWFLFWHWKDCFRFECSDRVDDQKVQQRKWEVYLYHLWESFFWEEQGKTACWNSSGYVSSMHCLWKELQDQKHSWPPLYPAASKWSSVSLDNKLNMNTDDLGPLICEINNENLFTSFAMAWLDVYHASY